MNGKERRTRAAMRLVAWMQEFAPEMAASVIERVGEAPPTGGLNQLGAAWDMFYPSMYYPDTGYRGRWHTPGEHLGQIDPFGGVGTPTTSTNETETDWASKLFSFAEQAIPAYLAYDAQKDIMEMNIARAEQGLDPIDPGVTAPQVRVVHDIPPETRQEIDRWKMGGMNILLWGGLAVGAFFVVRMLR